MSLKINDTAPDFKLFNTEKKEISLSDYKGKNVLVLFFPLAFTGTCTAELCHMRDELSVYSNLNAEILGISVDTVFSLLKYKEANQLPFNLLSDFNKTTSTAYGCLYAEFILGMKGVSKRSAFVVDKDGKIQYAEILEVATEQPNYENIKACLAKLGVGSKA